MRAGGCHWKFEFHGASTPQIDLLPFLRHTVDSAHLVAHLLIVVVIVLLLGSEAAVVTLLDIILPIEHCWTLFCPAHEKAIDGQNFIQWRRTLFCPAHKKATTGASVASQLQDDLVKGASPVEASMRLKILTN